MRVGAPRATQGAVPRVDSDGQPACERCGRRLSKCKGTKYRDGSGLCCSRCYKLREGLRSATAPASAPASDRSHKRKHPTASAAPAVPFPPLSPLPLHLQATFTTHRWSLQPSTRNSRSITTGWLLLATSNELKRWEEKRGGYSAHETDMPLMCSHMDELRVRLRSSSDALARTMLRSLHVDTSQLQLNSIRLNRAAAGQGLQNVHFDVTEYDLATKSFTVLLYITPTESTAVPTAPLAELRDTFTVGEHRPPKKALQKLQRSEFYTTRVEAGALLVFNAAVPHYGVANPDLHDRYVLFLHYSPRHIPLHDTEEQRYPHGVKD